ncbi:MAG: HU family DNA-binding protein [bacterium]
MNKGELLDAMAKKTRGTRAEAERNLNAFIDVVTDALKKRKQVQLVGFGTFLVKERAARAGVNPQTGEKMKIKGRRVPAFKAGAVLKGVVK